jgi:Pyridoxamine 5'-phosphate oxidase
VGRTYEGIDDRLKGWIAAQPMYFIGTAPLDADGHVNVSPKAPIDTLKVLDSRTVAYLDFVGSGAETIAHVRENGRIVIMLCAFQGPPRIVRLHGRAEVLTAATPEFDSLAAQAGFPAPEVPEASRSIVRVALERVADSCGYGVPLMTVEGARPHFDAWAAKKVRVGGPEALREYQRELNAQSIDGLPAVELPDVPASAAPR